MKPLKIVLPGGSGQVGTLLARAFYAQGHAVTVLSRTPATATWRTAFWNPAKPGEWIRELEGCDVLINLAGRSVNCRYHQKNRDQILRSRLDSVRTLGAAIQTLGTPPKLWLQASTATIYAHRFDAPNDERSGIIGGSEINAPDTWRFSIQVATEWEAAFNAIDLPHTRKVLLRSAMIMSPDRDGIFDTLRTLANIGLGGTAGDGRQYISWIHELDFTRAIHWLIEHPEINGAINLASPHPLPNREFMAIFRKTIGAKIGLPAMRWMLEVGAFFMRSETELILKSRRVIPGRLLEAGFEFTFPHWVDAAHELVTRKTPFTQATLATTVTS